MKDKLLSILESHGRKLHTLLLRLVLRPDVADDLFQELFVKLSSSSELKNVANAHAYVRRAAVNLAFDWRRRHLRAESAMTLAGMNIRQTDSAAPWHVLADADEVQRILAIVAGLPALMREAFVLRYLNEEEFAPIGQAMGRTAHQARALCHAAVREIRKRLDASATTTQNKTFQAPSRKADAV